MSPDLSKPYDGLKVRNCDALHTCNFLYVRFEGGTHRHVPSLAEPLALVTTNSCDMHHIINDTVG
jgi:hypothetical protein